MRKLAEGVIKLKWAIIIAVTVLTAFFGYQFKDIKINADIISSLPDDDPVALLYKNIGEEFGGNDLGMIVLETNDIFQKEVLEHIKQITDTLKYTDGISTVTSLTDVIDIKGSDWGIEIGKLVDEYDMPDTQQELDSLKQRVFSKEMYKGSIVSEDGTSTLIMFTILSDADKQKLAIEIKEKIIGLNLPEELYFGGLPMMMNDVSDLIMSDIVRLIPFVFFLIAFILFISFRTTRGVVLPLLTAGVSVIWTLGIMTLFGYEITMISNLIPVLLLAVGSAYTIHVLNRINLCTEKDREEALKLALAYIIIPVVLAAVTTAIGFISFVFGAYLTMIRDFGIFTALGVFFALLLSVFFVPALVSAFSMYKNTARLSRNGDERKSFLSNKILIPLQKTLSKYPKRILIAWVIILLLTIGGIFKIQRSVNMTDYFKGNNPTRVTEDIMQDKFGGSLPVYVVFKGDIQSPEVLRTIKRTQEYMETIPGIDKTQSIADLIEEMNDVMGEGKNIPDERAKIENLWFLLDGQEIMEQLVTYELDKAIIQSKFASADSKLMGDFEDAMETFITANSTDECIIEVTGMPSVYVRLDSSLIDSQISSLLIAIIMVLIIVGLLLRSFAKGIYATIPIIATIIILFGFMGITGIPLDIATVLVASIALGIGIDYSIHIITSFNHSFNENGGVVEKAIEETIMVSGKAIIINVVSVAAGFLVLLFSELVPLQNFGLLVALSMIGSGLGALTLLPVILILTSNKQKRIKS
jgi:predicted RND superfamily exporter protein